MKRFLPIAGAALLLAGVVAVLVPLWMRWMGMAMSGHGYAAVFLTVFFSFAVAGGLMFLIFYSARQGFDDAAQGATGQRPQDDQDAH
jgi:hypothetical protein